MTQPPRYQRSHRVAEMAAIVTFGALTLYLASKLATTARGSGLWLLALAVCCRWFFP